MEYKLPFSCNGQSTESSVIRGDRYRITVLTSRLIRLEYVPDGQFEDRPTLMAVNRAFPSVSFDATMEDGILEVHTQHLSLYYDQNVFSSGGLSIKVRSKTAGIYSTWHYGDALNENLGGTARTLDQADGAVTLDPGIQSRLQGFSVLDDSRTAILEADGTIVPREQKGQDLYFFGYGLAYQECLNDFLHLSGKNPLIPRWALGNWWSRFYRYTQEEYLNLIDRFRTERIPLSVAVIDMDWHITQVDPADGKGWTGYTWNRDLFPDHKTLLRQLHQRNLKISLNDHPAEGIQSHEERYPDACRLMGRDPERKQGIPFQITSTDYVNAYFRSILHPMEEEGVDLWWVDWQQGDASRFQGADPLWLLNHYHFWNQGKDGSRPMTFSRYAGPGSQRYPIGFSGDSIISWKSLAFQPEFTATAANVGYGWWSHDIGGHCGGIRDPELMVRWLQLGVFSPICRLHSTSNLFNGKEPWNYREPYCTVMKEYLRLRHRLLPYLYTMNWQCHKENRMPVRPMYYAYPESEEAYECPNQYLFGSHMIVSPIVSPEDPETGLAKARVWLPEQSKLYYDMFTGMRYDGGRTVPVFRALEDTPVFVRAGAIVPLTGEFEAMENGCDNPQTIELSLFAGDNGSFEMVEDDGVSGDYECGSPFVTRFTLNWNQGDARLTIQPDNTCRPFLPGYRRYTLRLVGTEAPASLSVQIGGEKMDVAVADRDGVLFVELPDAPVNTPIQVLFSGLALKANPVRETAYARLMDMRIGFEVKQKLYLALREDRPFWQAVPEIQGMGVSENVVNALCECLLASER